MGGHASTAVLAGGCARIMQQPLAVPEGVISTLTGWMGGGATTRPRRTMAVPRSAWRFPTHARWAWPHDRPATSPGLDAGDVGAGGEGTPTPLPPVADPGSHISC